MAEKFLKKQWFPVGGHEKLFADVEFKSTWMFATPAPVSPASSNTKMTKPSTSNHLSENLTWTHT